MQRIVFPWIFVLLRVAPRFKVRSSKIEAPSPATVFRVVSCSGANAPVPPVYQNLIRHSTFDSPNWLANP